MGAAVLCAFQNFFIPEGPEFVVLLIVFYRVLSIDSIFDGLPFHLAVGLWLDRRPSRSRRMH